MREEIRGEIGNVTDNDLATRIARDYVTGNTWLMPYEYFDIEGASLKFKPIP